MLLSAEHVDELRSGGFRPRAGFEVDCVPVPSGWSNDRTVYAPGFLYFARRLREDCELSSEGKSAPNKITAILRARWDCLATGADVGAQDYYEGLERIERHPKQRTQARVAGHTHTTRIRQWQA